ncbi:hypothetical protein [Antarctobacter sp.]|uniref:hypothetical protein n=1 Tax=Antarctobacter sp. TaxID=1872577 RepID=UPI003A8EA935
MRVLFWGLATIACLGQPVTAQDTVIETLLLGLTEEAESFHNLEETIRNAPPDQLFALYNRLAEFSDDRPDLVDIAIDAGLKSKDRAVRSRALWSLLDRASVLTMQVDYSEEGSISPNVPSVRKAVGGVVTVNLFAKSAGTRTVSLTPEGEGNMASTLSLSGTRISFTLVSRAGTSGFLVLSEDGTALAGRVDYREHANAPLMSFPVKMQIF